MFPKNYYHFLLLALPPRCCRALNALFLFCNSSANGRWLLWVPLSPYFLHCKPLMSPQSKALPHPHGQAWFFAFSGHNLSLLFNCNWACGGGVVVPSFPKTLVTIPRKFHSVLPLVTFPSTALVHVLLSPMILPTFFGLVFVVAVLIPFGVCCGGVDFVWCVLVFAVDVLSPFVVFHCYVDTVRCCRCHH